MTTERKARELLAEEYRKVGLLPQFEEGSAHDEASIRAITRALESAGQGEAQAGGAAAWMVGDEVFTSESEAIEAIRQWGPSGAIAVPLYTTPPAKVPEG